MDGILSSLGRDDFAMSSKIDLLTSLENTELTSTKQPTKSTTKPATTDAIPNEELLSE